jgi:catechol 2,3-dioxygenase-like lactoylglutathione lyase family enzyme
MRVTAIDHLVLTVRDLDATITFYTRTLGAETVTFGAGRHALVIGAEKLNLHVAGREFEPKAAAPTPGSADLCLLTASPPQAVLAHLATCGVAVVEGPVVRTGARGAIQSVYCRDPDGNLIEISSYVDVT